MTQDELDTDLEYARSLLGDIEFSIDEGEIDLAGQYASMLAEVLYKARLIELKIQADEAGNPAFTNGGNPPLPPTPE